MIYRNATLEAYEPDAAPIALRLPYGPEIDGPELEPVLDALGLDGDGFYLDTDYNEDVWILSAAETGERLAFLTLDPIRGDEEEIPLCASCEIDADRAAGREVDPIRANRALLFGCTCTPSKSFRAEATFAAFTQ